VTATTTARTLATFFGTGLFPKAPGTAASLAAALLVIPLLFLPIPQGAFGWTVAVLAVLAFAGSVWAARVLFGQRIRDEDPGWFVLDEACGMWIAAWRPDGIAPWSLIFAFAAFRVLDIVKPFPIGKLESAGDWGIVLDDAAAGAVALALGLLLDHYVL
jgi:phosphatidylglycerophosphatase A